MRTITDIIVHCAASPNGKDFHVDDIDAWHVERGFKRGELWRDQFNPELKAAGYHFVIPLNGLIETARHLEEVGAHVSGMNAHSIGICLIGTDKFTVAQWDSLKDLLLKLAEKYPAAKIKGHCQCPTGIAQGKTCPGFDIPSYVADGFIPDDNHRC